MHFSYFWQITGDNWSWENYTCLPSSHKVTERCLCMGLSVCVKEEMKTERKKQATVRKTKQRKTTLWVPCDHPPTHSCLSGDDASLAPSLHSVLTVTAAPSQHKNNKLQPYKPQFKKLASSPRWKWLQTSSLTIQMIQRPDLLLSLNTVMFCLNYKQQFLPVCKNQTPKSTMTLTESLHG